MPWASLEILRDAMLAWTTPFETRLLELRRGSTERLAGGLHIRLSERSINLPNKGPDATDTALVQRSALGRLTDALTR